MIERVEHPRVIDDIRLIAGYLRDAALSNHPFVLTIDDQEIIAHLLHIDESSARDKKTRRKLLFQVHREEQGNGEQISERKINSGEENHRVDCRVALDRLLIKFFAMLIDWDGDYITIESPSEASLLTSRGKHRFSAKNLGHRSTLVSISKEKFGTSFAYFEILNISSDGIGGYLESEHEIPDLPIWIAGTIRQDRGAIKLNGQVVRCEKLSKPKAPLHRYKIGIRDESSEAIVPNEGLPNKRKASRLSINIPIEIRSPLNSQLTVNLEVVDMSYSGISARFFSKADSVLFKTGMDVTLLSPRLNLSVLGVDKGIIKFKILPSAIAEHIQLFFLKSTLGEKDLTLKTPIPEDILQVYSVSGSLSSGLIKNIRLYRENILNSLISNNHTKPWFLRWMQQNEEGRIRSVVMTVPYGEHLWYCGGAAGHMDPGLKMSSNFLKRYFNANIEFFNAVSSKEYIFFNWFLDNARWGDWEKTLEEESQTSEFFRFDGDIVYFNDSSLTSPLSGSEANDFWEELGQGDFDKIDAAISIIDSHSLRRLFGLLGLNPFSYGGKNVKDLLISVGKDFNRRCFHGRIGGADIIVVLSSFPSYAAPNGILNYPFAFISHELSSDSLETLAFHILRLAIEYGIECHGFFVTMQGRCHKITSTDSLVLKKIRWTFGPADTVWKYWTQNES